MEDTGLFHLETLAVRAGQERSQFNEHAEALYLTSSFVFESAAQDQGLKRIQFVPDIEHRDLTIQRVIQRAGLRARMEWTEDGDDGS